jgi:hypothetical protein
VDPNGPVAANTGPDGEFRVTVLGGRYRVILEAAGYLKQEKWVVVADGDQVIFNIDIRRAK